MLGQQAEEPRSRKYYYDSKKRKINIVMQHNNRLALLLCNCYVFFKCNLRYCDVILASRYCGFLHIGKFEGLSVISFFIDMKLFGAHPIAKILDIIDVCCSKRCQNNKKTAVKTSNVFDETL